jgi:acyl-CoA synthetase (AMP-forming)/AMP-acid ligase II
LTLNPINLFDWLDEPTTQRGIRFARDDGTWDMASYAELAASSHSVAARLVESFPSVQGQIVSVVVPPGPEFVGAYFGVLLAGATPAPLVPPTLFDDADAYVNHTASLMQAAGGPVVSMPAVGDAVTRAAKQAGLTEPLLLEVGDGATGDFDRRAAPAHALLQFTSGSSGRPRGVRVTRENLEANITMIRNWIDWAPDGVGAHWLPLYHDMGLIGCTLTPTVYERDLWIMRPDQFIRDPKRWLDCFGRAGAHFTATPGFGFAYALRRVPPEQLEGSDFSQWRAAILGAERLDPGTLRSFAEAMAPHGFRANTFLPAYGLAECTLAVTGGPRRGLPRAVFPDWASMRAGSPVTIKREAAVSSAEIADGAGWILGCGQALAPTRVSVLHDGVRVDDGALGEIHVSGPTVADGYLGDERSVSTEFTTDGVRTGDAGFVFDGELFVVGRLGDSIKIRGRTVYAEDLEAKLTALRGVPRGRTVVLPGVDYGEESVTVITETALGEWVEPAMQVLRAEVGEHTRIRIAATPNGTIPRTSSGKPRRRELWQSVVDGTLPVLTAPDLVEPSSPERQRTSE